MSIRNALAKGDVIRTSMPGQNEYPLYLGSGSSGGCFDGWGFLQDGTSAASPAGGGHVGESMRLNHADHYIHGAYGIDCWLGLYRFGFADSLPTLAEDADYRQTLTLYEGCLDTAYTLSDGTRVSMRTSFNPYSRDILAYDLDCTGRMPDLLLSTDPEHQISYGQHVTVASDVLPDGFMSHTGTVDTRVMLRTVCTTGSVTLTGTGDGVRLSFPEDGIRCLILIGAANVSRVEELMNALDAAADDPFWMASCRAGWARRYGNSYVDLPDGYAAMMWARSLYYVLCSFAPGGIPSAPMGWTGFGWRFHFPQDVSYIHPALLRLGHFDLCKSVVEFYHRTLDVMKQNTARIYGGRGVMWAWEYPIHGTPDLLPDPANAPNPFQFEIHNAAYPARMAYETSRALGDPVWTRDVALPVIRESAEFYASHLLKEDNGRWSIRVVPSMSQDEYTIPDQKNYLCALYSTRYTLSVAAACGMTEYDRYLADGFSFDRLLSEKENLYFTSEYMTDARWGQEKHPIQLNPLTFLPFPTLTDAERSAYERREFICSAMQNEHFDGWTLTAVWLAEAHKGDGEALARDILRADHPDYTDPERLAFFETSGVRFMPYYVTSHGLMLQAVADAFLSHNALAGGPVESPAVPEAWKGAVWENLYDLDGKPHSGRAE